MGRLFLEGRQLDWRQSLRTLGEGGMGLSTVGVLLLRIFVGMQSSTQDVGLETLSRSLLAWYPQSGANFAFSGHTWSLRARQRDVLLLPVDCHDEDIQLGISWALYPQSVKHSHGQRQGWMDCAGRGAWKLVVVLVLVFVVV